MTATIVMMSAALDQKKIKSPTIALNPSLRRADRILTSPWRWPFLFLLPPSSKATEAWSSSVITWTQNSESKASEALLSSIRPFAGCCDTLHELCDQSRLIALPSVALFSQQNKWKDGLINFPSHCNKPIKQQCKQNSLTPRSSWVTDREPGGYSRLMASYPSAAHLPWGFRDTTDRE